MMAQHVAMLLLGPNSLWSSMMMTKYGVWTTTNGFPAGWGSSILWREIYAHAPKVISQIR